MFFLYLLTGSGARAHRLGPPAAFASVQGALFAGLRHMKNASVATGFEVVTKSDRPIWRRLDGEDTVWTR